MDRTEELLHDLRNFLDEFEQRRGEQDVRAQVRQLLPVSSTIQKLGKSLLSENLREGAKPRLLRYFRMYPRLAIPHTELAIVAGISEWARRIRELRIESGWPIFSGETASEMLEEDEIGEQSRTRK